MPKLNNTKKKIALIYGITGQDGSYLAESLLEKGYIVHGVKRRTSMINTSRIDNLYSNKKYRNQFYLHYGDITDFANTSHLVKKINPLHIYNLAAQSHVKVSFELPLYTCNVNALGALNILESIRLNNKKIKYYQASTSEMFGSTKAPQSMGKPFKPCSPYGTSKLFSYWITKNYRDSYGIFASNGILFNHESEVRGETFVTRKITLFANDYSLKKRKLLKLGNINAVRDWGYAKEYVESMVKIMEYKIPDDYLVSTGVGTSVKEFTKLAFKEIGVDLKWIKKDGKEYAIDSRTKKIVVTSSKNYLRPHDIEKLIGIPSKNLKKLNWKPKTNIKKLVQIMVKHDCKTL